MSNKCAVVGGGGFIGSHLVDELLRQRCEVAVYDDFSGGKRENLPDDILIVDRMRDLFMHGAVVYHLAASVDITGSYEQPFQYVEKEVGLTTEVLHRAVQEKAERIIYVSSSGVYDRREAHLFKSEQYSPIDTASPYATAKLIGEHLVRMTYLLYGIPCVSVRPFNVYGPRQRVGGVDKPVVPSFILALLRGEPLTVQGDGKQELDFIYVKDAARWLAALAIKVDPGDLHAQPVNLGTGESLSIGDLALTLIRILDVNPLIEFQPAREWYFSKARASTDIMQELYEIEYAPLEQALRETIDYYRDLFDNERS